MHSKSLKVIRIRSLKLLVYLPPAMRTATRDVRIAFESNSSNFQISRYFKVFDNFPII